MTVTMAMSSVELKVEEPSMRMILEGPGTGGSDSGGSDCIREAPCSGSTTTKLFSSSSRHAWGAGAAGQQLAQKGTDGRLGAHNPG